VAPTLATQAKFGSANPTASKYWSPADGAQRWRHSPGPHEVNPAEFLLRLTHHFPKHNTETRPLRTTIGLLPPTDRWRAIESLCATISNHQLRKKGLCRLCCCSHSTRRECYADQRPCSDNSTVGVILVDVKSAQ